MQIVIFCHSILSDWNHGNAHFLRGVATELISRGHEVHIYEPRNAWSLQNLLTEHGEKPVARFHAAYPLLQSVPYSLETFDPDEALDQADLVLVHEWNEHGLVRRLGQHRARVRSYRLLFHDTHHRAYTDRVSMAAYELSHYDGVLAFGRVIRDLYLAEGWTQYAWTWHEAADTRVFRPMAVLDRKGDLVWIGNWGDEERTTELHEFLLRPSNALRLKTRIYGVRYPADARQALTAAGIEYAGWLPNYEVPKALAQFKVTVHIPRRPYARALPGIPTIRVFEALACGVPLVCAPWDDVENLFTPGRDFLVASNGHEMEFHLKNLLANEEMAQTLAQRGHRTVLDRHTCAHRVDELLKIYAEMEGISQKEMVTA